MSQIDVEQEGKEPNAGEKYNGLKRTRIFRLCGAMMGCLLVILALVQPYVGSEDQKDLTEMRKALLAEAQPYEDALDERELEAWLFFKAYHLTELIGQWYVEMYHPPDLDLPDDFDSYPFTQYMAYLYEHPPGIRLDVQIEFQIPDMRYGCELASMSMMMQYASGIECTKYDFWEGYRELYPKDYDPYKAGPLERNTIFPCHLQPIFSDFGTSPVNLSGVTFENVLRYMVFTGHPVILWSAYARDMPWGHVFLLIGYDAARDRIYYNDPKYGIRYRSLEYLREITYYMGDRNFEEAKKLGSEIDDSYVKSADSHLYAISYL